jgi:hypothetical protein
MTQSIPRELVAQAVARFNAEYEIVPQYISIPFITDCVKYLPGTERLCQIQCTSGFLPGHSSSHIVGKITTYRGQTLYALWSYDRDNCCDSCDHDFAFRDAIHRKGLDEYSPETRQIVSDELRRKILQGSVTTSLASLPYLIADTNKEAFGKLQEFVRSYLSDE